ncbi:hypothetical protein BDY24DRAFT_398100 [Mrakia frigida]|uniref:uncharacterized protein n=1 Tax=Mrakia frigida TaxID=29902 RepID=UPI003FCBFE11
MVVFLFLDEFRSTTFRLNVFDGSVGIASSSSTLEQTRPLPPSLRSVAVVVGRTRVSATPSSSLIAPRMLGPSDCMVWVMERRVGSAGEFNEAEGRGVVAASRVFVFCSLF